MVILQKEKADGQKNDMTERLVARGFQKKESPPSDSLTMLRESLKLYFAVTINEDLIFRNVDIRAAFLQSRGLNWELFFEPPKVVKSEEKIWLLHKPFYGLNEASRKFWSKLRGVFEDTVMKRLPKDEAFYHNHNKNVLFRKNYLNSCG